MSSRGSVATPDSATKVIGPRAATPARKLCGAGVLRENAGRGGCPVGFPVPAPGLRWTRTALLLGGSLDRPTARPQPQASRPRLNKRAVRVVFADREVALFQLHGADRR